MSKREVLIFIFLIIALTFIRFLYCLKIKTPAVMYDEAIYVIRAYEIIETHNLVGSLQIYPPGYSLLLSIAFLFTNRFEEAFRIMQLLTSLISSITLIPIYLIIRDFTKSRHLSMGYSLGISTIPPILTYFFWLMSESLFIFLIVSSFYLLLKLVERENISYAALFGFINFYALFTRDSGIASNIASFGAILSMIILNPKENLKKLYAFSVSYLVPTLIWFNYRINVTGKASGYNVHSYMKELSSLGNLSSLLNFLRLYLNEVLYLFVVGYIVFTVLGSWSILDFLKERKKRVIAIYILILLFTLILITTIHMVIAKKNPEYYDYDVLGRYIDPVVPILFIIGYRKLEFKLKTPEMLVILSVAILLLTSHTLPINNYKPINTAAIYYITSFNGMKILAIIFSFTTAFVYLKLKLRNRKLKKTFNLVGTLIIFTTLISNIFVTHYYYSWNSNNQNHYYSANQEIIKYLSQISGKGKSIYLDSSRANYYYYFYSMWSLPSKLIMKDVENIKDSNFYLITNKTLLHDKPIASSASGYKIYAISNISEAINKGYYVLKYGWYTPESWGIWARNDSTLIFYSRENQVKFILSLKLSSFHKPRILQIYLNNELIYEKLISTNTEKVQVIFEANMGENEIRFHTPDGCQRPADVPELKSNDVRCLSFAFINISIEPLEFQQPSKNK